MSLKCCCMHAKSLWSYPTLCNPMDCSLPGSSVHGTLQARILGWVCHALLQFIFLTQGLNPHLLHLLHWWVLYQWVLYQLVGSLAPPGKVKSKSHSVVSDPLWPHGLYSPWNSPGQNTGVGSPSLLQRIFPTQGSNPGLPHCRWILYQLSHKGSPNVLLFSSNSGVTQDLFIGWRVFTLCL